MIHTIDPLERLRRAIPVPPSTVARLRADATLFHAVTTGQLDVRRPVRRRLRLVVPALAITSTLGGAMAYGVLRDTPPKPQTVACYAQADLEADTRVVGVGREGALAACAELWRRGALGAGGQVPSLIECVLPTAVAGVFPAAPGQDVCRSLVTAPEAPTTGPPPTVADVTERFRMFREAVLPRFVDAACVEAGPATDIVRRELDRAGLADWRIRAGDFSPDRPCATLSFRPENREVVLSPSTPRR